MTTVCVTGASGFIASHIVAQLLAKGCTVKATVRDATDSKKTAHLTSLPGAAEQLQLFSVNLMGESDRFDECIAAELRAVQQLLASVIVLVQISCQ